MSLALLSMHSMHHLILVTVPLCLGHSIRSVVGTAVIIVGLSKLYETFSSKFPAIIMQCYFVHLFIPHCNLAPLRDTVITYPELVA